MKKLLVLFLVVSSTISFAQESVLLRLNYNKGDVYNAQMTMSQEMGTMMSMGMNIDMNMKIIDVTDDTNTSEMSFTKMTMDMLQAGNVMSFDSTKSDDELDEAGKMVKAQMSPMLAAVLTAKGNNLGEVIEMKAEPNVPGMDDFANQSNVIYPKEAVKVGSTWTYQKNQKGMILDFVYTVKSILKDKVELDITGKSSGMATGDITGTMNIDKESGVPLSSVIDMKLSMQGQDLISKVTMTMTKL
ncbi:hypothetical protein SAMN05216503_0892 [Polaribacter sp. KT25b]|uniref:DUF6263 family protein n=1 Tax=Polaribacter sp. KT25b TaxID=1855336 RepID=UPI00087BBCF9|nr:DUF6263 family protein [Polaribacter sp. KT25b]SDR78414.1 hypothetical protein SAMN05216503_0892 [Polaribacter sp. KT25b]